MSSKKTDDFGLDDLISSSSIKNQDNRTPKAFSDMDISDIFEDSKSADGQEADRDPLQSMIDLLKTEDAPQFQPENLDETVEPDVIPATENFSDQIPKERRPVKSPSPKTLDKKAFIEMIKQEKKRYDERKNAPVYKTSEELRYKRFYPREVMNWIEDMKTPIGFYDDGNYRTMYKPQFKKRFFTISESNISDDYPDEENNGTGAEIEAEAEPGWRSLSNEVSHTPIDAFDPNEEETFWEEIPKEYRGHYRFGIKADESKNAPNKVKAASTYRDASPNEKRKFLTRQAMLPFQKDEYDTGAPAAMAMAVHKRVESLQRHVSQYPSDAESRHSYQRIVSHRHKLIKYLRRVDPANYFLFSRHTGMRDVVQAK